MRTIVDLLATGRTEWIDQWVELYDSNMRPAASVKDSDMTEYRIAYQGYLSEMLWEVQAAQ